MRSTALSAAVAAGALAAAAALDLALAEAHVAKPYDVAHVPSGAAARVAALGHRTFLSDLYWLSTVQYIGEPNGDVRGWDKLYPLADLVTDLDPRHGYAYQTAGIVLSSAGRLAESDRILLKGVEKGPPLWTLPYYLSFNHWFYMGDYATGAEYARLAATRPGASPNISHLAVSLSAKSGTPEDAIRMIEELRRTVKDEVSAARLDEQLKLAVLERDAQLLERAAERFRQDKGRAILSVEELLLTGYVSSVPQDPFGGRYFFDARDGKVHSSENPFRFQLHDGGTLAPRFQYQIPEKDLRRMPE
jgi:hypothetical protein